MADNILLIVADTARADIFYQLLDSGHLPNVQSLIGSGCQYKRAISPSPWSLPSHANIFTGRLASDHGAHAGNKRFDPSTPTIAELLRDGGYRTAALSGNIWISPHFGFERGFEQFSMKYDRLWSGADLSSTVKAGSFRERVEKFAESVGMKTTFPTLVNGIYSKYQLRKQHKGGPNTTRRTRAWIRQHGTDDKPFFYFLSYLEPHLEYRPPQHLAEQFLPSDIHYDEAMSIKQEPWRYIAGDVKYSDREFDALRALYKATLVFVDEQIGALIDELESQSIRDETTIIVVADHGENIGDYGLMDHQYCLYQTLVQVPLIISGSEFDTDPVLDLVSTRDLFPTILDIAGIEPPDHAGISRNSLIDSDREVAISEYLAPQPSIDSLRKRVGAEIQSDRPLDRTYRAIQTTEWKLIEASDGSVELYNLSQDSQEIDECSNEYPDQVEVLRDELEERDVPISQQETGEILADERTQQRLADLGYI